MTERDGPLTEADVDHYRDRGFVLLRGLFEPEELETYDRRFRDYVLERVERPPTMKIMKDIMVVKGAVAPTDPMYAVNKLISFEDDPVLYRYARNPKLLAAAKQLLGNDLYTVTTNIFNKPPGVDARHPMHQDLRYFRLRPADGIVGCWTAMAPATRESGCLAVLPGTHKGKLLDHGEPDWEYVNFAFFGVDVDAEERVHVEMEAGDTLLFHPLLIHGSGSNRSDVCRRAISTHYASATCKSPREEWRDTKQARHVTAM